MYSSSESEDDCYGNVARKLENLKSKYRDHEFETVELLDESAECVPNTCYLNENCNKQVTGDDHEIVQDTSVHEEEVDQNRILLDDTRRLTRLSARKANVELSDSCATNTKRTVSSGRGRKTNRAKKKSSRRSGGGGGGAGGGRGGGRGGGTAAPVYCVGDAEEYPDRSHNVAMFSKPDGDVVAEEDSDLFEQNEELSVKVCWRSAEYCSFSIRRHQKLSLIFKHFAEKGNVSEDRLLFIYNDKILKPNDTPDSIQYNIAKFIEGGVVSQDMINLSNSDQHSRGTGIHIKFQCTDSKKPIKISIEPNEKLSIAMIKCAEQLEQPLNKLKFYFDGYLMSGEQASKGKFWAFGFEVNY